MRRWVRRFSDWVVSHPVVWSVGFAFALVLLSLALDLAPMVVLATGAVVGTLNVLHAKRRGYCPLLPQSGPPRDE